MPVYQDFGPGIGAGISQGVDQFFQQRMQNAFLRMQQQQAADAHNRTEAEMVANYGYQPASAPPGQSFLGKVHDRMFGAPAAPAPVSNAAPVAPPIDRAAFSSAIGNMGPTPSVASPIPSAPTGRGAVTPPSMLGGSSSMLGPAAFQQNLEQSFGRAGIGAPNIPGSPIARQSAPAAPAGNAGGNDYLASLENAPRVSLSNGASIQPFAGLVRTLRMKQAEDQMATDEKIREGIATGATGEHQSKTALNIREANTPRLGDANYAAAMGDVERAKAFATLPVELQKLVYQGKISLGNALQEIGARGQVEAGLQGNQQTFTAGQNALNRTAEADRQRTGIAAENARTAGTALNQSALENQKQRDHWWKPGPVLTTAPSAQVAPLSTTTQLPALTDAQRQRAQHDPDYAAFLKAKGYP